MFFTREGQSILILTDRVGEPRLTLAVAPDGGSVVGLADKGDKIRAELSLSKERPRLAFYSKEERERVILNLADDGSPSFGLMDGTKSPRLVAGGKGDAWGIGVFDQKGKLLAHFGDKK